MNLLRSKWMAWGAMVVMVAAVVATAIMHAEWWMYIDVFCAFIMAFMHLMAVYMHRTPAISKQLDFSALIFGALAIVAFLCEWLIL